MKVNTSYSGTRTAQCNYRRVGAVCNRTKPQQTSLAKLYFVYTKKLDKLSKVAYNPILSAKGKIYGNRER